MAAIPNARDGMPPGEPRLPAPSATGDRLGELCDRLFASLPRRDQRRWAERYVRGLLAVPGRKTINRIGGSLGGPSAVQGLHHFVSNSTWDWRPVRRALAAYCEEAMRPAAWLVAPLITVKSGRHSVGLHRRFVPALGRVAGCQVAYGVWLADERAAVPVNWSLLLPEVGHDRTVIEAVTEVAGWGVARRPVVVDARGCDVPRLVTALHRLDVPFVIRVDGTTPVVARPGGEPLSAFALMSAPGPVRRPVPPRDPGEARPGTAALVRVGLAGDDRPLRLLAEWPPGRPASPDLWLAVPDVGRPGDPAAGILALARRAQRVTANAGRARPGGGLAEFEGRSYVGWHHHVTLASAAHAITTLSGEES